MVEARTAVQKKTIDENNHDQRLDNYLFALFRHLPKSVIYKKIRSGEVRINGGRAKPACRLMKGDEVRIPPMPQKSENTPKVLIPQSVVDDLAQRILFEDDHYLAVDKPSGLAVHGGSGIDYGLLEVIQRLKPGLRFVELVHRLDRDTSGVLLLAKSRPDLLLAQEAFKARSVKKRYAAIVCGHLDKNTVKVDLPLSRNQLESGERMVVVDRVSGKVARSIFRNRQKNPHLSLLDVDILTGRTHQIRVHAASLSCPLLGDKKYGLKAMNHAYRQKGFKRLFLHSAYLSLPLNRRKLELHAEIPQEFWAVLDE